MKAYKPEWRNFFATAILLCAPLAVTAHELPVGDDNVSTSPKSGFVFACQQRFGGGGADNVGDWFHGKTWDPAQKPHVAGEVRWPDAEFNTAEQGDSIHITGNNLPVGQPTGVFPISKNDPAYRFDRNPNTIRLTPMSLSIQAKPTIAKTPACLPMGMIALTLTGVAVFNALDAEGRDAAAHEVQDVCNGHPERQGQYHYHSSSPCLPGADKNTLVGWALDGFPIFGMRDASGKQLKNSDLDACHGRMEVNSIDGRIYQYAYRLTEEYPYTLGCFMGNSITPGG